MAKRVTFPKILPSVMSKTQKDLTKTLKEYSQFTKHVHLDVADGTFAPTKVLAFAWKLNKNISYSAHLMVNNPMKWIKKYQNQIQLFIPHFETFDDPTTHLNYCKEHKLKTAFAILPSTTYQKIKPYLKTNNVNYLLILTVNPGFYGSPFLPKKLHKIKKIAQFIKNNNLKTKIIIDGHMDERNIPKAKQAGGDHFVVGSSIKNKATLKDKTIAYKQLTKIAKQ